MRGGARSAAVAARGAGGSEGAVWCTGSRLQQEQARWRGEMAAVRGGEACR